MGCDEDEREYPPGFQFHMKHFPSEYYYFWSIGGVCLLMVLYIEIPHVLRLRKLGDLERRKMDRVFRPRAHQYMVLINLMPPFYALCKYAILLSPSTVWAMEFALHCFEAYAFLTFQQLITLYLGGPENGLRIMSTYPAKKIFASPPLCCIWIFCYQCIPHTHLTKRSLKMVYTGVYQFVFVMPLLAFIEVIRGYRSSHDDLFEQFLTFIRIPSVMCCMYSLFVYMRAASECLENYNIKSKFFVMKAVVVVASFIETAFEVLALNMGHKSKDRYNTEVMTNAYADTLGLVLLVPLAFRCSKTFSVEFCDLTRPIFVTEDFTHADESMTFGNLPRGRIISRVFSTDDTHSAMDSEIPMKTVRYTEAAGDESLRSYRVSVSLSRHIDDT